MSEVVCLGILVADVLARPVERYPERGRLVLVDRIELHSGGCAGNTAIGLSRIGIPASVIGKVGDDGFGDFFLSAMASEGVDAGGIVRDDSANTSSTMVLVHGDGERSFIHYIGANGTLRSEDVDLDRVASAKVLHVAGALLMPALDGEPTAELMAHAKSRGVTTSLDTVWDGTGRWMKALAPCLEHVDYFLPSIEEARMLSGVDTPEDVAQFFLARGVGVVALKMGEAGCYVANGNEALRVPAYEVSPIDATGAGDAFAAGFLAGVVKGWNLRETARFANAVGALCTLAIGTTAGIRGMDETQQFMSSTPLREV
ncbi:MAG: sugar kinase [Armatimonadota bacterium]|nr:MAG: sugar kinase [Armatimonadota bacterium]